MLKRTLLFSVLGLLLCGTLRAQFPPDLLPPSREELADSAATKVDTTRFKADSLAKTVRIDSLRQIWTASNGGAEVTTASSVEFSTHMPSGPADSALTDSTHLVQARHLWALQDTLAAVKADTLRVRVLELAQQADSARLDSLRLASAAEDDSLHGRINNLPTGGGASLEFLEGKNLPGIAALTER